MSHKIWLVGLACRLGSAVPPWTHSPSPSRRPKVGPSSQVAHAPQRTRAAGAGRAGSAAEGAGHFVARSPPALAPRLPALGWGVLAGEFRFSPPGVAASRVSLGVGRFGGALFSWPRCPGRPRDPPAVPASPARARPPVLSEVGAWGPSGRPFCPSPAAARGAGDFAGASWARACAEDALGAGLGPELSLCAGIDPAALQEVTSGGLLPSLSRGFLACKMGVTHRRDREQGSASRGVWHGSAQSVAWWLLFLMIRGVRTSLWKVGGASQLQRELPPVRLAVWPSANPHQYPFQGKWTFTYLFLGWDTTVLVVSQ